jgi:hypothetical protein
MSLNMLFILNCDSAFDIGQMERVWAANPLVLREEPLGGLSAHRIAL